MGYSTTTLGSLADQRRQVLNNTAPVLAGLVDQRSQALTGSIPQVGNLNQPMPNIRESVQGSLAAQRQSIQDSIATGGGTSDTPRSMTVLAEAKPNTSKTNMLITQAKREIDPQAKANALYLAALEDRYAQEAAAAQQGVQDATLAPGGDPIYGSPQQSMAKSQRGTKLQAAARNFNRGLPVGSPYRKEESLNPFYGA